MTIKKGDWMYKKYF